MVYYCFRSPHGNQHFHNVITFGEKYNTGGKKNFVIDQWNFFVFPDELIFFRRFYVGECRDALPCVPITVIADQSLVPQGRHDE
jgi:hypothetical protein